MVVTSKPLNVPDWTNISHEEMIDATHSAIIYDTGEVMSVQPNGDVERRPAGTYGAYEVAERNGIMRIYTPMANIWIFAVTG